MTDKHCKHKTTDEIRAIIRQEAAKAGGIKAWCKQVGIGDRYVYEVLQGMREPSAMVMYRVGYRRVIMGELMQKKG